MPFINHKLINPKEVCNSPEHEPPTLIHLEPGEHTWKCPMCGEEIVINIPLIN